VSEQTNSYGEPILIVSDMGYEDAIDFTHKQSIEQDSSHATANKSSLIDIIDCSAVDTESIALAGDIKDDG